MGRFLKSRLLGTWPVVRRIFSLLGGIIQDLNAAANILHRSTATLAVPHREGISDS